MESYYKILGVEKTASNDEIKKAYRKLAMILHPDKSGGDSARFNIVTEAYNILLDPEKRASHDNVLNGFSSLFYDSYLNPMTGFKPMYRRVPKISPDAKTTISINMGMAYVGLSGSVRFDRYIECKLCLGKGRDQSNVICTSCHGNGKTQEVADVNITIPPRTIVSSRVIVQDAGNIMADGKKGDLEVFVQYVPKYEGVVSSIDGTLYKDIVVPWDSALLGEKHQFKVFSCCEEVVIMTLNSSVQNGGSYRFDGLGMARQPLIVKVWYSLPSNIEASHRQLIANAIRNSQSLTTTT